MKHFSALLACCMICWRCCSAQQAAEAAAAKQASELKASSIKATERLTQLQKQMKDQETARLSAEASAVEQTQLAADAQKTIEQLQTQKQQVTSCLLWLRQSQPYCVTTTNHCVKLLQTFGLSALCTAAVTYTLCTHTE